RRDGRGPAPARPGPRTCTSRGRASEPPRPPPRRRATSVSFPGWRRRPGPLLEDAFRSHRGGGVRRLDCSYSSRPKVDPVVHPLLGPAAGVGPGHVHLDPHELVTRDAEEDVDLTRRTLQEARLAAPLHDDRLQLLELVRGGFYHVLAGETG